MPELPEVQTVLSGLEKALQGISLTSLECFYPGTVITDPSLDFDPFPARPLAFVRRGKYMLLHLDSQASLIIHLRMTGKLVLDQVEAAGRSCILQLAKRPEDASTLGKAEFAHASAIPLKHERARINLEMGQLLHFIDIRTFGKIILCKTDNVSHYLPELGLEPLSKEFGLKSLDDKLKPKKAPIKTALLDQRVVAGLGNIYVCELLYRAEINPLTPANELKQAQLKRIAAETVAVLSEAIALGGTSISDFRRIDDKTGEFQNYLKVYQKTLCPKGHEVMRIVQAGRSTFYCPVCQKKNKN